MNLVKNAFEEEFCVFIQTATCQELQFLRWPLEAASSPTTLSFTTALKKKTLDDVAVTVSVFYTVSVFPAVAQAVGTGGLPVQVSTWTKHQNQINIYISPGPKSDRSVQLYRATERKLLLSITFNIG